jgi:hypothetical protein
VSDPRLELDVEGDFSCYRSWLEALQTLASKGLVDHGHEHSH